MTMAWVMNLRRIGALGVTDRCSFGEEWGLSNSSMFFLLAPYPKHPHLLKSLTHNLLFFFF